jgi:hypothetical protein
MLSEVLISEIFLSSAPEIIKQDTHFYARYCGMGCGVTAPNQSRLKLPTQ